MHRCHGGRLERGYMKHGVVYEDAVFYVFSGTGNTLRVAETMAGAARERGLHAAVVSLSRETAPAPGEPSALTGVLTPTHGFGPTWTALRYVLFGLPRGRGAHAFAASTRGAAKLGRLVVPGFEGSANTLLAAALLLKGYRVRGICAFNMPANWLTLHPGYSVAGAQYVYQRVRPRVRAMIERIVLGRRYLPADAAIVAVLGLALLPVTVAYMTVGRPFLAKTLFASRACTNCGLCIRICPSGGLRAVGRARPVPYWTYRCEQCMRCVAYCPTKAVEANLPYLVGASLAAASPLAFPSVGASLRAWLRGTPFSSGLLFWLGWIAAVFLFAGVGQMVLFALGRTPFLGTVLSVTGVMHFYRKSHAPDVSPAEITKSRHVDRAAGPGR